MINSITIKNFETHISTSFDLHPGVNIIIGESDEGKSGIVRAIKWNARNRPQGESYRNDQLDPKKDKKEVVQVGINYKDSGLIIRERDGSSLNHYVIDNQEPLRALRTDIPQEVKDITKMKDVNIQGQHPSEQYFLLADKPGQVAKEFNKVAGLTIMDKATADINSQVRTCNIEIKVAKKEIETRQEEIDDTKWVDAAEKFAKKLEAFRIKVKATDREWNKLHDKVIHVEEITEVLSKHFDGMNDALKTLDILDKEKQTINDKKSELNIINNLIRDIKDVDTVLLNTVDTEKALLTLKALKMLRQNIDKNKEKVKKINNLIWKIEETEKQFDIAKKDLIEIQKEYEIIRKEQECPTCGRTGK